MTSTDPVPPAPPAPPAPPVPPAPPDLGNPPARETTWPLVIGIIAIVFGSLGSLNYGVCAPAGLLSAGFFGSFFEELADTQAGTGVEIQAAQLDALQEMLPLSLAVGCGLGLVSLLLLIGGIGLTRRRAWAPTLLVTWGLLKMVAALPKAYADYVSAQAQFAAMEQAATDAAASGAAGPGQMPPGFFSAIQTLGTVGVVFGVVWLWALPCFLLVWFGRPSVRREARGWRALRGAGPSP